MPSMSDSASSKIRPYPSGRRSVREDPGPTRNFVRYRYSHDWADLHRDRHTHVSSIVDPAVKQNLTRRRASYDYVRQIYDKLPQEARDVVRASGLATFIESLDDFKSDLEIIEILREFWWDTTHTFHLPWGEITMTPTDFTAITAIPCGIGEHLEVDFALRLHHDEVAELLGFTPQYKSADEILIKSVKEWLLNNTAAVDGRDVEAVTRLARTFLFYTLGVTIFANASTTLRVSLLGSLRHIDQVSSYDWGQAGLAELYFFMDHASRNCASNITGFSIAWEIWAYAVSQFQPFTFKEYHMAPPFMINYQTKNRKVSRHPPPFNAGVIRSVLTQPAPDGVSFFPWGHLPEEYEAAFKATSRRILMVSVMCDSMYLGDRVVRQHGPEISHFAAPPHPPPGMLAPNTMPDRDVYIVGTKMSDSQYPDMDYDTFLGTVLYPQAALPRDPDPVGTSTATSSGTHFVQEIPRFVAVFLSDGSYLEEEIPEVDPPPRYLPRTEMVDRETYMTLLRRFFGLCKMYRELRSTYHDLLCEKTAAVRMPKRRDGGGDGGSSGAGPAGTGGLANRSDATTCQAAKRTRRTS